VALRPGLRPADSQGRLSPHVFCVSRPYASLLFPASLSRTRHPHAGAEERE